MMRLCAWTCVSAFVFTPVLWGQVPLSLADALSQALIQNPQIATAEAQVSAAQGYRHQAGLGPNPRLYLQSENTRLGPPGFVYPRDADTYAFVAQTFETGGKRQRRIEVATENLHRTELEQQFQRQQIISRVSIAYWAAASAARARNLLQQEANAFERVVQFHRDRVQQGASAEVDLIRIEVERDRLASAAATTAEEAERTRITLFQEMGKNQFPVVDFTDSLEKPPSVAALPWSAVLEKRPELQLGRARIGQAQSNRRLQQANARPDPDASLGYKRTFGYDTLYASVQIPLPVRNRNQGQIEAAVADIRAAQSSLAATEAMVRAELDRAQKSYESRQKLLEERLRPMRDRADQVYRIQEAAYREGGSDILRLLDAERSRIETQLLYTRTLSELQQSAVAVATAQGNLP
jgi:cobalt-zinc-cadmium efflux system outer membrane protein